MQPTECLQQMDAKLTDFIMSLDIMHCGQQKRISSFNLNREIIVGMSKDFMGSHQASNKVNLTRV